MALFGSDVSEWNSVARGEGDDYPDGEKPADLPVKQSKRECVMKRLALALAAATMVALSVPANAQRIYVDQGDRPWAAGPKYYYDSDHNTYYGGWSPPYAKVYVVTPRVRTYVYDGPRYRYGYGRDRGGAYAGYAYSGPLVGYRSWDVGGEYRYRGWGRGW
jgi:hypothetical protein